MSSNFAAAGAAHQWIEENRWTGKTGSGNLPVILLPTAVSTNLAAGPFQVQNGFGTFELDTIYDGANDTLQKTTLHLVIPVWGREKLLDNVNVPLKDPKEIEVKIPDTGIGGKVKFFYDTAKKEILLSWKLDIPWLDKSEEDGLSLFSTSATTNFTEEKLKSIRRFSSTEINALATPASHFQVFEGILGKYWKVVDDDHLDSKSHVLAVQTYNATSSKQSALDLSFLGIFHLTGSIDPTSLSTSLTLYVSVPIWGRVNIAEIKGGLIEGIVVKVDVKLAKGTVNLNTKSVAGGKHDLYIKASLDISILGHFDTGDLNLFTLPLCPASVLDQLPDHIATGGMRKEQEMGYFWRNDNWKAAETASNQFFFLVADYRCHIMVVLDLWQQGKDSSLVELYRADTRRNSRPSTRNRGRGPGIEASEDHGQ
ncbi:hypothetical protein C8J56DRAFT_1103404 [Mycena floridula]|nr:hypothetical protein C8J56DRAFT_1103404 [Mycena floridula]